MGRAAYLRFSSALSTSVSVIACLLCASGCHNTCITGALNGGTTVNVNVGNPPSPCPPSPLNGIVHVEIGAAPGAAPGATGPHIDHLFVNLAGVDAHSSALASDDSPGWQPLAPELEARPLQIDLLADPQANASSAPLPDAILPAGVYRQIRLRLAAPPQDQLPLQTNRCAAGATHCAVMSDGRIWPLALPLSRRDIRIVLESTPSRELDVSPNGVVALAIQFDRDHSWLWPSGDSLLFAPVFHLSIQPPPDISEN